MSTLTPAQLREIVLKTVQSIAPEAELDQLDTKANLREQADLDSVDFLNLIVRLHQRLGIDIPEADYPKLNTLDGFIGYLASRLPP